MQPRFPRTFPPLAWSNLAAQSAEQLSLAAAPLVAVLVLGAGTAEIGLLTAVQTLPFLLLALPLGVLADRMVLGFLGAVGTVGFGVAVPGLVSSLVPRASLANTNARLELARSAAFAAGPAVAGALVSWAGASAAFVLAAMMSVFAIGLLSRVTPPPAVAPVSRRHPLREVAEGAAFVWRNTILRPIIVTGVIFNLSWFILQAAYVPYAIRTLGLNAVAVGTTMALYGVGMIVGALTTIQIVNRLPLGRAIQVGPVAGVLAAASLAATLVAPSIFLAGMCFFLLGA
ncbi:MULTISPECIES: MFS transporter [unclassified Delftia]|uniref:MFS transporter n=1 Tax=unclassified Delftia TaxID=2613839 RepID=UPI002D7EF36A|nr:MULTISPECIES: MFS transporter [unclassified Delftia]